MEALKLNVETTRKASKSKASKSKSKGATRGRLKQGEKIRAASFFGLAVCGLAVSLPHLADELRALTGTGAFASWLVAIVIDLGMIATKAHLSADGANKRVAWSIVASCTLVSIVLNSHAFFIHASPGFGQAAALGFGLFLPLFILSLSYMGSEILNRRR